ncbi:MAG: HAMP domain-containing protein [Rhodocyclales bacterium]|nr:HAMP domain-containing protein [Rhodocyclales bacterium]
MPPVIAGGRLRSRTAGWLSRVGTRLTLWHTGVLGAVLLAYAAMVYGLVRGNLADKLDRHLHRDFEVAAQAIYRAPDGSFARRPQQHLHDEGPFEAEPLLELWRPGGELVLRRADAAAAEFKLPAPDLGQRGYTSFTAGGVRLRVLQSRLDVGEERLVLRIARSEETLRRELAALLLWMGMGLPLALALAAFGGHLLARRALDPLARMNAEARSITADNLSARLPVVDPDDELGQLAATFNAAFQRLEQSFLQLRAFAADAAHELRTPLAALKSLGEVALLAPRSPAEYRDCVGAMLEEADRLQALVNGLLLLARIEQGRLPVNLGEVELGALAEEAAAMLRELAEEKRQTLRVTRSAPAPARADGVLLRQAVLDLLDNAIKFSPPGAAIELRARLHEGKPVLEVRDSGPGIAWSEQSRVFDRFYRCDPSRTHAPGSGGFGLGLAIARSLTETQGGRIELDSTPGCGATFRIVLPAAG